MTITNSRSPIKIDGFNKDSIAISGYDFLATRGGASFNVSIPVVGQRADAPKFLRESDMRPSTMQVLGKKNVNNMLFSKDTSQDDGMTPHFGNARGQPKGLLSSGLTSKVNGPIMRRPDNQMSLTNTKLK